MKIIYCSLIVINLLFSIYLVFRAISNPFAAKISRFLGISKKRSIIAANCIYIFLLAAITIGSMIYLDLLFTGVVSSAICFFIIVRSKILIDNSPYYTHRPSRSNRRLSSLLTLSLFFSVFIMLLFLGNIF